MEKLIVLQKVVNAKLFNTFPHMELMILNVCVNIHSNNTIETVKCAKEKNVQDAKGSEVLGHVHAVKSIKNMRLFHRLLKKEKNKINQ